MEYAQNTDNLWSMEYPLASCPFEFHLSYLRCVVAHGSRNLVGTESSRCQKVVQLCSRLFPNICPSLSLNHVHSSPYLETIIFRPLCINTLHHFSYHCILSFLEKVLPNLPTLRRQRSHHPCSPQKLSPASFFFF